MPNSVPVEPAVQVPVVVNDGSAGTLQQVIISQLAQLRDEQRDGFASVRDEFNNRIDRLVTNEAFQAEQSRVNDKFSEQGRKLTDERTERKEQHDKLVASMKWVTATILVPLALLIIDAVKERV